jgi:allophanate hydrolase
VNAVGFDVASLRAAYRKVGASPVDVAREALRRIETYRDPAVWIARVPEAAVLARAQELRRHPSPETLPLFGIPFAVKDNIDCAGSRPPQDARPSPMRPKRMPPPWGVCLRPVRF